MIKSELDQINEELEELRKVITSVASKTHALEKAFKKLVESLEEK